MKRYRPSILRRQPVTKHETTSNLPQIGMAVSPLLGKLSATANPNDKTAATIDQGLISGAMATGNPYAMAGAAAYSGLSAAGGAMTRATMNEDGTYDSKAKGFIGGYGKGLSFGAGFTRAFDGKGKSGGEQALDIIGAVPGLGLTTNVIQDTIGPRAKRMEREADIAKNRKNIQGNLDANMASAKAYGLRPTGFSSYAKGGRLVPGKKKKDCGCGCNSCGGKKTTTGRMYREGGRLVPCYKSGGAIILGGQRHAEGGSLGKGNPVVGPGNEKVAETEREELLLNDSQTQKIEAMVQQIQAESNPDTKKNLLRDLGRMMQIIVLEETEDKSGKFTHLQ